MEKSFCGVAIWIFRLRPAVPALQQGGGVDLRQAVDAKRRTARAGGADNARIHRPLPLCAMTLLHTTMLMLTASCALLLVGFSARESRWGPLLMMAGIVGALLLIAYNIFQLLPEH